MNRIFKRLGAAETIPAALSSMEVRNAIRSPDNVKVRHFPAMKRSAGKSLTTPQIRTVIPAREVKIEIEPKIEIDTRRVKM